jgi:hypothetical protein
LRIEETNLIDKLDRQIDRHMLIKTPTIKKKKEPTNVIHGNHACCLEFMLLKTDRFKILCHKRKTKELLFI